MNWKYYIKLSLIICISFLAMPKNTQAEHPNICPKEVFFQSSVVQVGNANTLPAIRNLRQHLGFGNVINICLLTPDRLNSLTTSELEQLLLILTTREVKLGWIDDHNIVRSGRWPHILQKHISINSYDKTNAAVGLIFNLFVNYKSYDLIAKIISAAPKNILDNLKKDAKCILTPRIVNSSLNIMAREIQIRALPGQEPSDNANLIQNMSYLVSMYLTYWAKKDPTKIEYFSRNLIDITRTQDLTPERAGALCGSILAGTVKTTTQIMEGDIRKILIAVTIGNVINVATGLIALISLFSPAAPLAVVAIVVPNIIGMISTLIPGLFSMRKGAIRDYRNISSEILGSIQMFLLQSVNEENKSEIYRIMAWMRAAVHINSSCF